MDSGRDSGRSSRGKTVFSCLVFACWMAVLLAGCQAETEGVVGQAAGPGPSEEATWENAAQALDLEGCNACHATGAFADPPATDDCNAIVNAVARNGTDIYVVPGDLGVSQLYQVAMRVIEPPGGRMYFDLESNTILLEAWILDGAVCP